MRRLALPIAAAIVMLIPLLAAGLASARAETPPPAADAACMDGVPQGLRAVWERICTGESRNRVLDYMHGGIAAFAAQRPELAERSFDIALEGIEAVYADNEQAAKARSLWHAESVKDFKGEPHERMMAYYYRGLIYLMRGDWDNAQATFQGGVLQDTFAEQERYRADVGSLVWLQGWANRCRGNTTRAAELFAEAQAINAALKPPRDGETFLVIAEAGEGPRKFAAGKSGETLGISEGAIGNYGLILTVDQRRLTMTKAEDTFFQATTRGGRAADHILAEKRTIKDATDALGKVAIVGGAATMAYAQTNRSNHDNNTAAFGAVVALVGLLAYAASQAMITEVDTRTWANLPHSVFIAYTEPPHQDDSLGLLDPAGRPVLVSREAIVRAGSDACSMAWIGAHAVTPSLAAAVTESGSAGNCRTSTGALAMMEPSVCARIGGQPLGQ